MRDPHPPMDPRHLNLYPPSQHPDHPYEYPISEMRPDGGIKHPSPPPAPYYSPPHGPDFQQDYDPDHPEILKILSFFYKKSKLKCFWGALNISRSLLSQGLKV
ncbi:hypothetical protein PIB30_068294 [Stylosanthes scabra]|uniref:Uncharacterized protein n=1 Tax=Stylosanthes scabra TaxID=79078 RepID=A0ABU6VN13_9FABA|nr:hypothetical protein [Stylosanthes scabra]